MKMLSFKYFPQIGPFIKTHGIWHGISLTLVLVERALQLHPISNKWLTTFLLYTLWSCSHLIPPLWLSTLPKKWYRGHAHEGQFLKNSSYDFFWNCIYFSLYADFKAFITNLQQRTLLFWKTFRKIQLRLIYFLQFTCSVSEELSYLFIVNRITNLWRNS